MIDKYVITTGTYFILSCIDDSRI